MYRSADTAVCVPCRGNTISSEGARKCLNCGKKQVAEDGNTKCGKFPLIQKFQLFNNVFFNTKFVSI